MSDAGSFTWYNWNELQRGKKSLRRKQRAQLEVVLGETLSSNVRNGTAKQEQEKNENWHRKLIETILTGDAPGFQLPCAADVPGLPSLSGT